MATLGHPEKRAVPTSVRAPAGTSTGNHLEWRPTVEPILPDPPSAEDAKSEIVAIAAEDLAIRR